MKEQKNYSVTTKYFPRMKHVLGILLKRLMKKTLLKINFKLLNLYLIVYLKHFLWACIKWQRCLGPVLKYVAKQMSVGL